MPVSDAMSDRESEESVVRDGDSASKRELPRYNICQEERSKPPTRTLSAHVYQF
jgi:hypothetical protein